MPNWQMCNGTSWRQQSKQRKITDGLQTYCSSCCIFHSPEEISRCHRKCSPPSVYSPTTSSNGSAKNKIMWLLLRAWTVYSGLAATGSCLPLAFRDLLWTALHGNNRERNRMEVDVKQREQQKGKPFETHVKTQHGAKASSWSWKRLTVIPCPDAGSLLLPWVSLVLALPSSCVLRSTFMYTPPKTQIRTARLPLLGSFGREGWDRYLIINQCACVLFIR